MSRTVEQFAESINIDPETIVAICDNLNTQQDVISDDFQAIFKEIIQDVSYHDIEENLSIEELLEDVVYKSNLDGDVIYFGKDTGSVLRSYEDDWEIQPKELIDLGIDTFDIHDIDTVGVDYEGDTLYKVVTGSSDNYIWSTSTDYVMVEEDQKPLATFINEGTDTIARMVDQGGGTHEDTVRVNDPTHEWELFEMVTPIEPFGDWEEDLKQCGIEDIGEKDDWNWYQGEHARYAEFK